MIATHCPYCALQCGMNLASSDGRIAVLSRPDFPTNKGGLCSKGWTSASLLDSPQRLLSPLMRREKGSPLEPVSWNEAIGEICRRIAEIQKDRGVNSIGVFGGGGLTNEKAYALGKFARVALRTSNIDYNGRFCMSSAAAANIRAFGIDRGLPFPIEDIANTEAILLVGSNVAETMPPIMQYFDAQKRAGGCLIVVDPRKTPTATSATLHLQTTPGTDLALANGMLHIAIEEGVLDEEFIASRTNGFDAVKRSVASYWPDRVERMTGVPIQQLRLAVKLLAEAKSAMILTARGAEQHSKGVDTVLSFINLALALGKVGKPNCGYGCVTGQGNGQGGREHGQKADQLPGYRRIDNPEARAHIASVWGIEAADLPGPGLSAVELLGSIGTERGIEALIVMGSNPVVSAPNAGRIREKLAALKLLVVSDIFLTETALLADVVLPTAQWAEEEGTMTNLEGRVLLRRKATEPPVGVKTDLEVIKLLSEGLGHGRFFSDEPAKVFEELGRASEGGVADYSGISYERIAAEDGVFWPCPSSDHPGTPRLFLDRFATPDGRARFHAVMHRPAAEEPDEDYPLYLTTGRVMAHYQSGAQTRRVKELSASSPEPFVEMHPALASRLNTGDGCLVSVRTRRGRAILKAKLTQSIRQDTIFVPFHWGGHGSANLLTNPALDPVSKMPEFKVCAAKVESMDDG
ncbi:molybdopterin oxidoreductase family protein [Fimbriimonas ginsengisoli]|uniref:Molybdopterin oxidoreductase n=1 Tax=Fimbriimonas ginsengisoli Gsoil 348 TaxID=661478 RepID=A0A068NLS3_FIMGI|nr:molybdopterin oxidoreductase family protein [Fimbriimonas ginsengisoli]AIE84367.1 molybdopterin oxidoreductase [Fimbriimonas ginsengisoli Gsoil 348]